MINRFYMKQYKVSFGIFLTLLLWLFPGCSKDIPAPPIIPQINCWEINNWAGPLPDSLLLTQEEPLIPNVDTAYINWFVYNIVFLPGSI